MRIILILRSFDGNHLNILPDGRCICIFFRLQIWRWYIIISRSPQFMHCG